jgi:carbon monoxide dehydrogenase subunit G
MKLENNFTIDAPVEKAWKALNSPETVAPCFPGATLTDYEGDSFTGTVKVKLGPIAMTYKGKGTYVSRDEAAHEVVIDANGRDSRGNGTANATVTASLAAEGPDKTSVSMVTDMTITGKPAQFGRGVISDVADRIIKQFSACVARKLAEGEEPAEPAASGEAVVPVSAAAAQATGGVPAPTVATAKSPSTAESSSSPSAAESAKPAADGAPSTNGTAPGSTPGTSEAEAPASTAMASAASVAPAAATGTPPRTTATSRNPVRSEVDAIDLLDTAGAPVLKRLAPVAGGAVLLLLVVLLLRRLRSR